jgi:nitrite reductase (NO-forming)
MTMTQFDAIPGIPAHTKVPIYLKVMGGLSIAAIVLSGAALSRSESGPVAAGSGGTTSATQSLVSDYETIAQPADIVATRYDPATKPVAPGPKTFELVTTEKIVQIGDKKVRMWMFNGTSPGPVLRAVVGDRITIKISNDASSTFFHSVDFHASRLTLGGGHVQVKPGGSGEYSFVAEYPGVFMYHCATAPVVQHIGMGMYGMLIVQPKEGFGPPVSEFAVTQSEIYSSLQGIQTKHPVAMAFNGVPTQYVKAPIKLAADQSIRLFVLNAGPSELSSFHVVGTVFDRVLEDGNPRNATYGRQTLPMGASSGGVFEMKFVGEGQFPMVTHQFNHAAMGAVGMFLAGDGKPGPGAVADPGSHGHS